MAFATQKSWQTVVKLSICAPDMNVCPGWLIGLPPYTLWELLINGFYVLHQHTEKSEANEVMRHIHLQSKQHARPGENVYKPFRFH